MVKARGIVVRSEVPQAQAGVKAPPPEEDLRMVIAEPGRAGILGLGLGPAVVVGVEAPGIQGRVRLVHPLRSPLDLSGLSHDLCCAATASARAARSARHPQVTRANAPRSRTVKALATASGTLYLRAAFRSR